MAGPAPRGLFGKLPSRGDFVSRGLPAAFLVPWERWVGQALAASHTQLGEDWKAAWLVGPVWRFALPAGACGPDPVVGAMLPSVDRVERGYPLMVGAVLAGCAHPPATADATAFLDAVEDAARDALAEDVDPDDLAARIAAAPPLPDSLGTDPGSACWWTDGAPRVPPMTLMLDGLPAMPDHAFMLAGDVAPTVPGEEACS